MAPSFNKCTQFKITWQELLGTTEIISYQGKIDISPFHKYFPLFPSLFIWLVRRKLSRGDNKSGRFLLRLLGFAAAQHLCPTLFISLPHLLQTSSSNLHTFEFFVLPRHFVRHFESSRAIKPSLHATSGFFWNRCIWKLGLAFLQRAVSSILLLHFVHTQLFPNNVCVWLPCYPIITCSKERGSSLGISYISRAGFLSSRGDFKS